MNGPELVGSLCRIRPLQEGDAQARWDLVNDGESRRLISGVEGTSFDQVREWCKTAADRKDRYEWAVTALDLDEYLGEVQLVKINHEDRNARLRLAMRQAYRGRGYAVDYVPLVLDYAFAPPPNGLGLHRVYTAMLSGDARVHNVFVAIGFTFEGRLRQTHWDGDRWLDTMLSSILAEEWVELRRNQARTADEE